jgi:DNA-binding HxlR family transcriptional regulator
MSSGTTNIAPEQRRPLAVPATICPVSMRAIADALEFLGGKWKMPILGALFMGGKQRFRELERSVPGITPKMLSKELQDLEMNRLIVRRVLNTKPVTVEYELTAHAESIKPMLDALSDWGLKHRRFIMNGEHAG